VRPLCPSPGAGIPEDDKNSWADSCPTKAGYDELGNYMTYNTAICFAAVGHITRGQAERMHYVTSEENPVLYVWGQYYASTSPLPPPTSTPELGYNNTCRVGAEALLPPAPPHAHAAARGGVSGPWRAAR
jgi:hypothetical protein